MDTLLNQWCEIINEWRDTFCQERTLLRAIRLAIGSLCAFGRRTLSRSIAATGNDQQDWSADYKLYSRSNWSSQKLFRPTLKRAAKLIDEEVIAIAYDDTKLHKTGRNIQSAFWQRDPMSPPFNINLIWGLRFLQASILLPMYRNNESPPRAIPVQFTEVPAVKKPGKRASDEEMVRYEKAKKENNLANSFVEEIKTLRMELDKMGFKNKTLLATVDGSFCNKKCFSISVKRTEIIARARKDAALCFREKNNKRRFYGRKFTPEMIRQDDSIPWKSAKIFHGGQYRDVRYKELNKVLWQRGTKRKELRLIVIAPTPYRLSKKKKLYYRQPAYLLTTATNLDVITLVQKYFDRWQIEVNFREEKDLLGVGQAQVRSSKSVPRQPTFVVAAYSALLLSSVLVYKDRRSCKFIPLPKWRKNATRPSVIDLISQLRREAANNGELKRRFGVDFSVSEAAFRAVA